MNIVFMGTPDFSVKPLESLLTPKSKHRVSAVFTQTDKPVGRKQILTSSAVKLCAQEYNIPVYQPTSLKLEEVQTIIRNLCPDVIVVIAYGKILPKNLLEIPKYGCINIHASLLPKYRGAAPIQWSIINGETKTGVTSMLMDEGLDTGDILLKSEVDIEPNENAGDLWAKLSMKSADLLLKTLDKIENSSIIPKEQDESLASYAPMLSKEIGKIDFNKRAEDFHNMVRGLNPWPVVSVKFKGKSLKIYSTEISDKVGNIPGEVISVDPLIVSCIDKQTIQIKEVQLEGKKRMNAKSFVLGVRLKKGDIF